MNVQERFNISFDAEVFFKKPKTQLQVIDKCKGDMWEANRIQNALLNYGTIKVVMINNYLHYQLTETINA